MDEEAKIYEILSKLQKENLFEDWQKFSGRIMMYFEKEWGHDNPPSLNEIIETSEGFIDGDESAKQMENVLGNEDFITLMSFMVLGFDEIINGKKV